MKVSKYWVHGLIFTLIISISGLIFGGMSTYDNAPPTPGKVVGASGKVLFTEKDIQGGQAVFQKYGLMDYGSVFGHGAYLGPDFTAEYLHKVGVLAREFYARSLYNSKYDGLSEDQKAAVDRRVISEQKANRFDEKSGLLTLTPGQEYAYQELKKFYAEKFTKGAPEQRIPENFIRESDISAGDRGWLSEKPQAEQLGDFFAWTAWAASAQRPGLDYSYTNNWPPDDSVGNRPTAMVLILSNASIGGLLALLGLMLWVYKRFNLHSEETGINPAALPTIESFTVTPSQVKTGKYFFIVAALFLVQTLVGAFSAHYFVDTTFFGIKVQDLLPFNIARGWHLQLAVFWVATAWLGTGIFVAPLVGGKEPKGQGLLVDVLFGAVVVVAVGSLLGEWLGVKGYLDKLWFLFGNQGWEYLELGRVWQILLLVGMAIWLFIVARALVYKLRNEESKWSLSHLLLYSAISIPAFYGFGLFYDPSTNFTVADFWRWFVIHLWVEGMFEFFAVVVVAYLMVTLGFVSKPSATRSVYFTLILVFGSGLLGTGHHYYYNGAPAVWMALGAIFSALEVVPLTLLIFEAMGNYTALKRAGAKFQYGGAMMFLIATSIWNFVGAGILGFIANLPIVNYYEHGTYLTPAHGHASMMGVYGMLALGLMMFSLRTIVKPEFWNEKLVNVSFWLLNIGLIMMLALDLLPVGFLQLAASYQNGAWYARSFDFVGSPIVRTLTWLRLPGDVVFISGVIVLLVAVASGVAHLRTASRTEIQQTGKVSRAV